MTFDYDLVVIGGTPDGRYAAQFARSYGARVALVEPTTTPSSLGRGDVIQQFSHLGRSLHQMRQGYGRWMGGHPADLTPQWHRIQQWMQLTGELANPAFEASKTQIDVIQETGCFTSTPSMAVVAGDRLLRGRAYLLATGTQWVIPAIDGIDSLTPLTPDALAERPDLLASLKRLVIVGGDPVAIELAQTLQRLGIQVTLAVPGDRLLPGEDLDVTSLLLALLEAEGVRVLTHAPLTHLRWIEGQLWLQVGVQAIEADQVLIAQARQPAVEGLHLDQVGVRVRPWGIPVNSRLRTQHPRIYACGNGLGGYASPTLGRYEAAIAVKNALLFPGWRVQYSTVPWALLTSPAVARVGWTESQARQRYGAQCVVLTQSLSPTDRASAADSPVGLCKLVATSQGHLLGAQLVGSQAEAGISAIALAMQHRVPVSDLAHWTVAPASGLDLVQRTAALWPGWRSRPLWRDGLEEWFNLRRG